MNSQFRNISLIKKAADELGLPHELNEDGNYLIVRKNEINFHFVNNLTPFNSSSIYALSKDKAFAYDFLNSDVKMPKTKSYLDPACNPKYNYLLKQKNIKEIVMDIEKKFDLPLMVKMNRGSFGRHVFVCKNKKEVKKALKKIYNKKDKNYDYIALAQTLLDVKREFRAIYFRGEILLVYEKSSDNKLKSQSPLHNDGARATLIQKDDKIYSEIEKFVSNSSRMKDVEFSGLDIAVDTSGEMWLLEVNDGPIFSISSEIIGPKPFVEMYRQILQKM